MARAKSNQNKTKKSSSGLRKVSRARAQAVRIRMKINRYKKHKKMGTPVSDNAAMRYPNRYNWDTKGLEHKLKQLETIINGK